jgi:hypothetical protein
MFYPFLIIMISIIGIPEEANVPERGAEISDSDSG